MCGIAGFFDTKSLSSQEELNRMTDSMYHRGPDGRGVEFLQLRNVQVGLGHRRLSILDLTESGTQPMYFQQHWICFNGEVYNFAEIKIQLQGLGHTFQGNSDTEVILHAYLEWGKESLHKFIGMFAFLILNEDNGDVFMARDRAGVKPFFYYVKDGLFLFASELKAFHAHQSFERTLNLSAIQAFVQYGSVPTPHCIFENTHKLEPGSYANFNIHDTSFQNNQQIVPVNYWSVYDAYNKEKLSISWDDARSETEKILTSACRYRMVSDVPVGVFLSGGYDSASVAALLQKDTTEKLKTFTISVPDIGLDEAPYAKDVATHLGTDHTEIACTEKEAIALISQLPFHYDEPFADSSAIPTTLVSLAARKHVTVALSADAGDEVFAGYNRYDFLLRYGKKMNAIPAFMRKSMAGAMDIIPSQNIPILRNKYNFHNRYEKLKGVLKDPSPTTIMLSLSQQFTDSQVQKMMREKHQFLQTAYVSEKLSKETYSSLAYMMAIDYETYLVDDILQKVDRATMTASLEGREPYLDHRVIEWAAQLPDDFKYKNGEKKYILKEIVHRYIPKSMMDRPKMGFAIPIAHWLKTDLKELVFSFINETNIKSQAIFNWSEIQRIRDGFYGGKTEYDSKLWYILMFQMWYERWMK
ncbi:MAG TPA: asparagine synthase (glutamine-hydrolyzing) [Crocinitomicaceae bacterium]|nr:asparagine synthase (glutamine-hydrolyzing) [Flavobacteriales bacterium]HBW87268.1 asparagine synthase (glutamine-hydrolyzing) [Crocinitomicaceae bacterium]